MRLALAVMLAFPMAAADYLEREMQTTLAPASVAYSVLLPDGYGDTTEPLPLFLYLHGGGGSRDFLKQTRGWFEEAWRTGVLPKMVVVTPSAGRSFYMDYKNGSQKWESILLGPFLNHVRATYKVRKDRQGTFIGGISMGGLGSLRMALKKPEMFAAVTALEPGIDPVIEWKDMQWKWRFWRSDAVMEAIFGKPFDAQYWEANNPATIAHRDAGRLRNAGLAIYVECGDEDSYGLDDAAEFFHRVLRDHRIPHEYHLVHRADHVGRTVKPRTMEAFGFIQRVLHPVPPDAAVQSLRERLAPQKKEPKK